jgi:putative glutamine amidotransferase
MWRSAGRWRRTSACSPTPTRATRDGPSGSSSPPPHPRHEIEIAPGSLLEGALDATSVEVNSFHHQAIDRLGEGLAVVAVSADGVAEAIEIPGRPVLAVQWELQEEWRVDPRFLRVFEWFVEAARGAAATA